MGPSSSMSDSPSSRTPVRLPQMISPPLFVRISTQEVLPPWRTVRGPGEAIEPRVPQNVTRNRPPRWCGMDEPRYPLQALDRHLNDLLDLAPPARNGIA